MTAAGGPAAIECPECDGLGSIVRPCTCVVYPPAQGLRCILCEGSQIESGPCDHCGGGGRAMPQYVVTVIDLDTAAVASVALVPGALPPPTMTPEGRWVCDYGPLVKDLAGRVGAARVEDNTGQTCLERGSDGEYRGLGGSWNVPLPHGWFPDLPASTRAPIEAAAIVSHAAYGRWEVLTSRSEEGSRSAPDVLLPRWCALADNLLVDLVIERRWDGADDKQSPWTWGWSISLAFPGAPLVDTFPVEFAGDPLWRAVAGMSVERLLDDLGADDRPAPRHFLEPVTPPPPQVVPVDELERLLVSASQESGAACATWRNGAWHVTPVSRTPDSAADAPPGGEPVYRPARGAFSRDESPPKPSYLGEAIGGRPCPACAARDEGPEAADICAACVGARVLAAGGVLTLSDLGTRSWHVNWDVAPHPARIRVLGQNPAGGTVVELPEQFSIAALAKNVGVRLDGIASIRPHDQVSRLDARAVVQADVGEAFAAYVRRTVGGRPAGRVITVLVPAPRSTIERVVQIGLALGLDVVVSVRGWHLHQTDAPAHTNDAWSVSITSGDGDEPVHPTLGRAVDDLTTRLATAVRAAREEASALALLPVPHQLVPHRVELAGIEDLLRGMTGLAQVFAGVANVRAERIVARFSGSGIELLFAGHDDDADEWGEIVIGSGPTLSAAAQSIRRTLGEPEQ